VLVVVYIIPVPGSAGLQHQHSSLAPVTSTSLSSHHSQSAAARPESHRHRSRSQRATRDLLDLDFKPQLSPHSTGTESRDPAPPGTPCMKKVDEYERIGIEKRALYIEYAVSRLLTSPFGWLVIQKKLL